ncbi:MAG: DNA polymerase III subunit delta' [Phycisphaerales bacterium]|nr:DNA polymerase III subunit delta' [Phycisphaerales bacterium]
MRFHDVKHQERALSILRRSFESGRIHHAYLFDGPEGVGKELTARVLAARLLCDNVAGQSGFQAGLGFANAVDEFEPCGDCRSCRLMESGGHPDYHLIERGLHKQHPERSVRKSKGLFLVVDLVRHFLIEHASAAPTLGRRRVFVMRDAERMNEEAQNALLKTLEEPPGRACLILVTSSAQRLLPTIRSRCQAIPFGFLPVDFVAERLIEAGEKPDAARSLAALSQGRLGAALLWRRMALLEVFDAVAELAAKDSAAHPEAFGKRMIELATDVSRRVIALEREEADRLPGTAAVRELEAAADAAEEEAEQDDDEEDEEDAGPKKVATDKLRDALKLVLSMLSAFYRDVLVDSALRSCGTRIVDESLRMLPAKAAESARLAQELDPQRIDAAIRAIAECERMIDRNVAPQLACEHLAIASAG